MALRFLERMRASGRPSGGGVGGWLRKWVEWVRRIAVISLLQNQLMRIDGFVSQCFRLEEFPEVGHLSSPVIGLRYMPTIQSTRVVPKVEPAEFLCLSLFFRLALCCVQVSREPRTTFILTYVSDVKDLLGSPNLPQSYSTSPLHWVPGPNQVAGNSRVLVPGFVVTDFGGGGDFGDSFMVSMAGFVPDRRSG